MTQEHLPGPTLARSIHVPGPSNETRGVGLALLSATGFGFLGILGRLGQGTAMDNSVALGFRFALAALLLLVLLWVGHSAPRLRLEPFALGAVLYAAQSLLFFEAVERLDAGKATLLLYTYPGLVTLLDWLVHKRAPSARQTALLALVTAGCTLILHGHEGEFALAGIVFGLASALVYSVYLLASQVVLRGVEPNLAAFNVCAGTALSLMAVAWLVAKHAYPASAREWGVVAGLAIICTVVPTTALLAAIRDIGPARAALCCTLEPVIATLLGVSVLDESFTTEQVLGAAAIVGSIVLGYCMRHRESAFQPQSKREIQE